MNRTLEARFHYCARAHTHTHTHTHTCQKKKKCFSAVFKVAQILRSKEGTMLGKMTRQKESKGPGSWDQKPQQAHLQPQLRQ